MMAERRSCNFMASCPGRALVGTAAPIPLGGLRRAAHFRATRVPPDQDVARLGRTALGRADASSLVTLEQLAREAVSLRSRLGRLPPHRDGALGFDSLYTHADGSKRSWSHWLVPGRLMVGRCAPRARRVGCSAAAALAAAVQITRASSPRGLRPGTCRYPHLDPTAHPDLLRRSCPSCGGPTVDEARAHLSRLVREARVSCFVSLLDEVPPQQAAARWPADGRQYLTNQVGARSSSCSLTSPARRRASSTAAAPNLTIACARPPPTPPHLIPYGAVLEQNVPRSFCALLRRCSACCSERRLPARHSCRRRRSELGCAQQPPRELDGHEASELCADSDARLLGALVRHGRVRAKAARLRTLCMSRVAPLLLPPVLMFDNAAASGKLGALLHPRHHANSRLYTSSSHQEQAPRPRVRRAATACSPSSQRACGGTTPCFTCTAGLAADARGSSAERSSPSSGRSSRPARSCASHRPGTTAARAPGSPRRAASARRRRTSRSRGWRTSFWSYAVASSRRSLSSSIGRAET